MSRMGWAVTLGGIRYQGRPLSAERVRIFQRKVRSAVTAKDLESAVQEVLYWAFPLSWGVIWRGDPVRKILAAPDREALLADFYASLRSAQSPHGNPTTGTDLRPQTATP